MRTGTAGSQLHAERLCAILSRRAVERVARRARRHRGHRRAGRPRDEGLLRRRRAGAWWQVAHSVTTPRALGPYAIEWTPTDFCDDVLGRLGGVFRGTVMQVEPGRGLLRRRRVLAAARRRSDRTDGARSHAEGRKPAARRDLRVTQTGFEESARWRRYYEVIGFGWERALGVAEGAAGKVATVYVRLTDADTIRRDRRRRLRMSSNLQRVRRRSPASRRRIR